MVRRTPCWREPSRSRQHWRKYGAFIAAAALITPRHDIERWTGIAISLASAFLLCNALRPLFVTDYFRSSDAMVIFWLQPVVMLIAAAAVWRMGTVLAAPAAPMLPGGVQPSR